MSVADPVLVNWNENQNNPETVYEQLTTAISTLQELDPEARAEYHVVWKGTEKSHDAAKYTIEGFDSHLGEPTILIEGSRGGNYEIITKSYDYPWIQYLPPNQPQEYGWSEKLTQLAVLTPDFEYIDRNGWQAFISNPFEVLKNYNW